MNFGAVYESGQAAVPMSSLEKEENNKGKSLMELQQDAGNANVALQQDYMTLLSHTMSQEDYAKACEDGFDPRELDQDTAVTSWIRSRQSWCVPDSRSQDIRMISTWIPWRQR